MDATPLHSPPTSWWSSSLSPSRRRRTITGSRVLERTTQRCPLFRRHTWRRKTLMDPPSPLSSPTGWHGHLIRSVYKFLERVAKRHEARGEPQMCPMEWLHCNLFIGRENGTWTTQKRDSSSPPREIFIVIIRCASVAAAERLATAAQQHWRKKKYQRSTQCSILCRYNPFSFLCHPGEILMNRWPHSMFVPCHRSTSDPPTDRLAGWLHKNYLLSSQDHLTGFSDYSIVELREIAAIMQFGDWL